MFLLYFGPIAVAAWLIIGGIAYGNAAITDSEFAAGVVFFATVVFGFSVVFIIVFDFDGSHGPPFASGMIGLGLFGFHALCTADAMDCRILFKALGGMVAGWVVEENIRPVGRLLVRRQLARRRRMDLSKAQREAVASTGPGSVEAVNASPPA
jgi:hypothetical protein